MHPSFSTKTHLERTGKKMERILLVDDEEAIQFAFKQVLSSPSVVVDTAPTLRKALHLLQYKSYMAVIADLRLSAGSHQKEGFEIIRETKRMQSSCVVMVVTGYGEDGIREKALKMGADLFLEKPASPERVKEMLQSMLVLAN